MFFSVENCFCPTSPEDCCDGRERQFLSLRARVMLLLTWLGSVGLPVRGDCVALPSTAGKDQSFEVLPLADV